MVMKTTVVLKDEIYALLVSLFGKKKISAAINKALFEHLVKEKEVRSMFGAAKRLATTSRADIRDHYERYP